VNRVCSSFQHACACEDEANRSVRECPFGSLIVICHQPRSLCCRGQRPARRTGYASATAIPPRQLLTDRLVTVCQHRAKIWHFRRLRIWQFGEGTSLCSSRAPDERAGADSGPAADLASCRVCRRSVCCRMR